MLDQTNNLFFNRFMGIPSLLAYRMWLKLRSWWKISFWCVDFSFRRYFGGFPRKQKSTRRVLQLRSCAMIKKNNTPAFGCANTDGRQGLCLCRRQIWHPNNIRLGHINRLLWHTAVDYGTIIAQAYVFVNRYFINQWLMTENHQPFCAASARFWAAALAPPSADRVGLSWYALRESHPANTSAY